MDQTVDVLAWETIDYEVDIVAVAGISSSCDFLNVYSISSFATSEGYYGYHEYVDPVLVEDDLTEDHPDFDPYDSDPYDPETVTQRSGCAAIGHDLVSGSEMVHDIYIPISLLDSGCSMTCQMPGDGEIFMSYTVGETRVDCNSQSSIDGGLIDESSVDDFGGGGGDGYLGGQLMNFPSHPSLLELVEGQTYEVTIKKTKKVFDQAANVENGGSAFDMAMETSEEITETKNYFTVPIGGYDVKNDAGMSRAYPCDLMTGECSPLGDFVTLNISV